MLHPVPARRRASAGGGPDGSDQLLSPEAPVFLPNHPDLDRKIRALHARLPFDPDAQASIDAHLPTVAAIQLGLNVPPQHLLDRMSLLATDAPQLGNLPDLGPLLRSCLIEQRWGETALGVALMAAFPCPRAHAGGRPVDAASAAPLLNLLLGTLLGVYPACVKRPPLPARAALYGRVHKELTAGGEVMAAFVKEHPNLIGLALTEYISVVVPLYFPAEHEALLDAHPVGPFFAAAPSLADQFRQEHLDTGLEPWADLERAAAQTVDRVARAYSRSKCRAPPHPRRPPQGEPTQATLLRALATPRIVPYGGVSATLQADYAILAGRHEEDPELSVLHNLLRTAPLPSNIFELQHQALRRTAQRCERRAALQRTKHLCLLCERRGRRGAARLSSRTFRVVCQTCRDNESSIVTVDMLGRVLWSQGRQYVLAPCCGTVQEYRGTGQDLCAWPCPHGRVEPESFVRVPCCGSLIDRDDLRGPTCPVCRAPRALPGGKRPRALCATCGAAALSRAHETLDHLRGRLQLVHLCQRHTPPEDLLRRTCNRRQFDRACAEWDARARPRRC